MEKLLAEWRMWQREAARAHLRARAAMCQRGRALAAVEWQVKQAWAQANAMSCLEEILEEWYDEVS